MPIRQPRIVYQDESAGDLVDYYAHGPAISGGSFVAGRLGDALDDYQDLFVASAPSVTITGDFSVCFWAKPVTDAGQVVDFATAAGRLKLSLETGTLFFQSNGLTGIASGTPTADSNWHLYTATRTAAGAAKVYEDTTLLGTATITLASPGAFTNILSGNEPAEQFMFFEYALTTDEIAYLYNGGSGREVSTWTITSGPAKAVLFHSHYQQQQGG